jgi:16S rRNA (adenine1518-N6/adenine1519-N6)-dimethyltransferase
VIHTPRKRFGQNFLIDNNIIAAIIAAINPLPGQHILEIGPGEGVLTEALVASKAKVDAVEIDRDLAQQLQNRFTVNNFNLHCIDVLKFAINELKIQSKDHKLRIVGNLPYNISTPLLFKLFNDINIITDMFFMLQHEVALRLAAKPNTKDYGRMSVMAQYYCDMQIILNVPPTAFEPAPKVNSSVVHFIPHLKPTVIVANHDLLHEVVTQAFSQRRKTIANSLKPLINSASLNALQIDPQLRAENLTLFNYAQITNYISAQGE